MELIFSCHDFSDKSCSRLHCGFFHFKVFFLSLFIYFFSVCYSLKLICVENDAMHITLVTFLSFLSVPGDFAMIYIGVNTCKKRKKKYVQQSTQMENKQILLEKRHKRLFLVLCSTNQNEVLQILCLIYFLHQRIMFGV